MPSVGANSPQLPVGGPHELAICALGFERLAKLFLSGVGAMLWKAVGLVGWLEFVGVLIIVA